jgi:8-oxo-dGTP pyrophosphatase MutT (NUDIX family)
MPAAGQHINCPVNRMKIYFMDVLLRATAGLPDRQSGTAGSAFLVSVISLEFREVVSGMKLGGSGVVEQPLSCGFLILRGNPADSFLLMRHSRRWDLPKGHLDPGETEMQCALRELHEETGISAEAVEVDPDFQYENRYMVNQRRYGGRGLIEKRILIFLGWLTQPVQIQVTEHDDYRWFPWNPPHQIQEWTIDPLLHAVERHLRLRGKLPTTR